MSRCKELRNINVISAIVQGGAQCSRKAGYGKDGAYCKQHAKMRGEYLPKDIATPEQPPTAPEGVEELVEQIRDIYAASLPWQFDDATTQATALITGFMAGRKWQDISTAPRDGTQIILNLGNYAVSGIWIEGREGFSGSGWLTVDGHDSYFAADVPGGWIPEPKPGRQGNNLKKADEHELD